MTKHESKIIRECFDWDATNKRIRQEHYADIAAKLITAGSLSARKLQKHVHLTNSRLEFSLSALTSYE